MKEPIRMQESDQLPTALREAFGALGRETPSAESVLRVQRALSALPAAAPGAAAVGMLGVGKLLVIATLVAGAVTTGVLLRGRLARSPLPEPASVELAPSEPALLPSIEPSQTDAVSPVVEAAQAVAANPSAVEAAPHAMEPSKRRARQQPGPGARVPHAELSGQWVRGLLVSEPNASASEAVAPSAASRPQASSATVEAAESEPKAVDALEPPAPEVPSRPGAPTAQASEAQRLAQCKRLAQREPAEALRQVLVLARDVPNGVFMQERELLTIRLHQQLGHHATASALARSFLERYPNSVYRHKLAP